MSRRGYRKPVKDLAGYKTHVSPSNGNGQKDPSQDYRDRPSVPSSGGYRQQALPVTPKHEKRRDQNMVQKNGPSVNGPPASGGGPGGKSVHKDKVRTPGKPGEQYGHPYVDNGAAGMKGVRPLNGGVYPSPKQKEQGGDAKRDSERSYREDKSRKQNEATRRYNKLKNRGDFKADQERRRKNPERFKRTPGGSRSHAERSEEWRKTQGGEWVRSRGNPSQDSENYFDRGRGRDKVQKKRDERVPLQKGTPSGQSVNSPGSGSGKVIPEGFDYVNKSQREPAQTAPTQKTAVRISDIVNRCSQDIQGKSRNLRPKLKRVDTKNAMWMFEVPGSKSPYTVKVQAYRQGSLRNIAKLDVVVSCSCPFWRWQGPEHWAKNSGYLYGRPQGSASRPVVKDPSHEHGACKHALAVLSHIKAMGTVRKEWKSKRGSLHEASNLRYLADSLVRGETRILNAQRLAARYIWQVLQTQRGD